MKDITIIEKDEKKGEWKVRLNTYSRPYGLPMPLSSNKDIKLDPGVTYNKDGKPITNADGKPLLVPSVLIIPGNYTKEQVLDIVADIKKKEEMCSICRAIKEEVKKGNVRYAGEDAEPIVSPEEAEKLLKKYNDNGAKLKTPDTGVKTDNKQSEDLGNTNKDELVMENVKPKRRGRRKKVRNENNITHVETSTKAEDEYKPLFRRIQILERLRPKRIFK